MGGGDKRAPHSDWTFNWQNVLLLVVPREEHGVRDPVVGGTRSVLQVQVRGSALDPMGTR